MTSGALANPLHYIQGQFVWNNGGTCSIINSSGRDGVQFMVDQGCNGSIEQTMGAGMSGNTMHVGGSRFDIHNANQGAISGIWHSGGWSGPVTFVRRIMDGGR